MTIKKLKPTKICKLERCSVEFTPKVPWQNFCCPEHHVEYWADNRKSKAAVIRRLDKIEKELLEQDIRIGKIENNITVGKFI